MSPSVQARHARQLPSPLPLVGRTAELGELEDLLESGDGPRSVVFLRGESGVGKSRLVAELAARAERRSWRVAHGRAYPVESGVPYAPFSDAWLPILRGMESSTLTVLTRGAQSELRYLFPGLDAESGGPVDVSGSDDPDEFRTRIMWIFAEFLKSFAAREPVLCILEDLHWADDSSLHLLHFLARQTVGQPVLFVSTYSDQERDRSPQLVSTERSLVSLEVAKVLRIEPLNHDQVGELIRRSFGVDAEVVREFTALLYGWTRGNPFFAEEIARSLVASGHLRLVGDTWVGWEAKELRWPGSVRDAVTQRIRAMSQSAQSVSETAAIVGTRARYGLLAAITGIETHDLLAALEELTSHGILEERGENGDVVFHFRHPLVREILYSEFGLARAQALHGSVAEAMEAHYGARAEEHADELAYHFARAQNGPLRAKASAYLLAAGRRALERRADREAIGYLEAAITGSAGATPDADTVRSAVPALARACTHLGEFERATGLWAQALDAMPAGHPKRPDLFRTLGMTRFWCDDHDGAHADFDRGLEEAKAAGNKAATARLLISKAHCLHEAGRGGEALDTLEPALELAEALGDPGLLARVHRGLALLRVWVGPPEKAEAHAERAIELAERVGDVSIEFWARWGLAVLNGMRGDTHGLAVGIERINQLADRAHSPVLRLWTADMAVELAYFHGEWDAGVAGGLKAIALARALNQRTLLCRVLAFTSQIHVARGEYEEAIAMVAEAEEVAGLNDPSSPVDVHSAVPTYLGKAHFLLGSGDFEGAIAAAEKGLEIAEGTGYVLWALHQALPILAEACLWADHVGRAEEIGGRMRSHARTIDHRLGLAWADACDALVKWKRGDSEGSIPLMRRAIEQLESIPAYWHANRLRRQMQARLRDAGHVEEAKAELDKVWAFYTAVRAGPEKDRARRDYHDLGLKPPVEHNTDGPLGLTPEELEVAKLVAEGLSNREIARARGSSTRTVSTHCSNIYKKLGIGGAGARMRLANMVREAGLLD